jgi:hypothetical protein
VHGFLQEQEFVDVVKEIQDEAMLDKVTIFKAMEEFE